MRRDMQLWPEVLFIDGTYELINTNHTVIVLAVEDSVGRTRIVGICLLSSEDIDSFEWFLTTFKNNNIEACKNIQIIMGDKDHTQRQVLNKVFKDVKVNHTFVFFTLCKYLSVNYRALQRITKYNISKNKKKTLKFLQQLAYSRTEQSYSKIYRKFCKNISKDVVEYFNELAQN